MAEEFVSNEQDLCARIIQDVLHLWCGETPVDGDGHRIHHACSEEKRKILSGASVQKSDTILFPDSRIEQTLRRSPGKFPQISVRPGHAFLNNRSFVWKCFRVLLNDVAKRFDHYSPRDIGSNRGPKLIQTLAVIQGERFVDRGQNELPSADGIFRFRNGQAEQRPCL